MVLFRGRVRQIIEKTIFENPRFWHTDCLYTCTMICLFIFAGIPSTFFKDYSLSIIFLPSTIIIMVVFFMREAHKITDSMRKTTKYLLMNNGIKISPSYQVFVNCSQSVLACFHNKHATENYWQLKQ